jgi:hypothetical protein
MRVTPLLAFLALAAPPVATAGPDEPGDRVPFSSHERRRPPRTNRDWVRLATPTPTRYGTEYIVVGRDAGWFRTLRIEVTSGTVMLRSIRLTSRGALRKTFHIDRRLDARHPVAYIDLGGQRLIDQLAVTTDRYPRGAYVVDGSSGRFVPPREVAMR